VENGTVEWNSVVTRLVVSGYKKKSGWKFFSPKDAHYSVPEVGDDDLGRGPQLDHHVARPKWNSVVPRLIVSGCEKKRLKTFLT